MICILKVVEGPAAGTKCWLNRGQRIVIGRLSTADFSIASDQHMSRTHMIVEGSEIGFRLRDGGSANGTYVNDARISLIELRVGDRIRAGTSVFSVEFEEEQADLDVRDRTLAPPADYSVPHRTLSAEDLGMTVEGLTARFSVAPPQQHGEGGSGNADSSGGGTNGKESQDRADSSLIPSNFLENFPEQQTPFLWIQKAEHDLQDPKFIVDQLSRVVGSCELCLIVNRSQLDEYEQIKLDEAAAQGASRRLTETLFSLTFRRKSELLKFYKRCLNRDAAVLVATPRPIQDKWILEAIDALSYPSMLFDLLKNSDARAKKIAEGTHFILFEINTEGEMCLLRAS